ETQNNSDQQLKKEQDERMAILGRLTARVAHELNSPLDGMLRYVNLSLNRLENGQAEKVPDYLRQVKDGLNQCATMLASLLDFSRGMKMEAQRVDPNKLIDDSIKFLEVSDLARNKQIIRDYSQGLPPIMAGNMASVFANICKNALQATEPGGRITIRTAANGDYLQVNISDTGKGIEPEIIDDIFKPFFTTKKAGDGTGLGLAICKEIVERRDGTIIARNMPTGGCEFEIKIKVENK
ncbi:MAG: HAMP domain-containing histidine kinase, partial [Sedimentisphaerales bacterium]|nr:HAMP domain-containing histidine kinase [Sedimentisphaerales bacterium]